MRKTTLSVWSLMLLASACVLISAFFWPSFSANGKFPLHSLSAAPGNPVAVFLIVVSTLVVALLLVFPKEVNRERLAFLGGWLLGLVITSLAVDLGGTSVIYGGAAGAIYMLIKEEKRLTSHCSGPAAPAAEFQR